MWKVCPEAGGPVQFPGFHGEFLIVLKHVIWELHRLINMIDLDVAGELICPAYQELCSSVPMSVTGQCPGSCSFNGDCIDGKCHCFLSFHGNDCSKSEFTRLQRLLHSLWCSPCFLHSLQKPRSTLQNPTSFSLKIIVIHVSQRIFFMYSKQRVNFRILN